MDLLAGQRSCSSSGGGRRRSWTKRTTPTEACRGRPRPHSDVFSCGHRDIKQGGGVSRKGAEPQGNNLRRRSIYSLRHCSQSTRSGPSGTSRCSALRTDSPPRLFEFRVKRSCGRGNGALISPDTNTHRRSSSAERDTLRLDLRQPLDLTRAAGQRLRHHQQQVGVFDALGVEEPAGGTEAGS